MLSVFDKVRSASVVFAPLSQYTLVGSSRGHAVVLDEPEEFGGGNLGPDPMEMVALSLAACTSLTIKMYAQRRKWNVDDLSVTVEHSSYQQDDGQRGDRFKISLKSFSDIGADKRDKLDDIAEKCPVHKMLHGSCLIERHWENV